MTKRIVSMLLSLALLLSCVSGITLFTAAADPEEPEETLPTPLAQWDANSGTFVNNGFCPGWGGTPWTNPPVEQIPGTEEYGVKLTGDWAGGWFGGMMFANAKADTAYEMVIEYYIDMDFAATDHYQMFRYAMDNVTTDLFTDTHKLASKESATVSCYFSAEQVAAFGSNDKRFYVYGCKAGTNVVYIQSMKLVEAQELPEEPEVPEDPEDPEEPSDLPAPYACLETKNGKLDADFGTGPLHASATVLGNTDVVAIGDTGMYGIKLPADWAGFYFGGDLGKNVPEGKGAIAVIECYATAAGDFLRFVGNSVFVGHSKVGTVEANKTSLIFVEFTAEQVAAWGTDVRMGFQRTNAAGDFYVKSIRLVDPEYVNLPKALDCDYYDFAEPEALCDYYPDITVANVSGMSYNDGEKGLRYFTVTKALASSHSANEPVYIKVYTTKGNENIKLPVNTFQVYKNGGTNHNTVLGVPGVSIDVVNGVGGVYIPETCFTNGLNGMGSFRFSTADAAKIARVEVYKVATYCNGANVDAEVQAVLHEKMLATSTNVKVEGYVAATPEAAGQSGVVYCATCSEKLADNKELPKLEVFAQLDFSSGETKLTSVKSFNASGNTVLTPVQIPDTDVYGLQITTHNAGFNFTLDSIGITEEDLANGTKLAISVEYFMPKGMDKDARIVFGAAGNKNLAFYKQYGGHVWDAAALNPDAPLVTDEINVAHFLVGQDVTYHAEKGQFGGGNPITAPTDVTTIDLAKAMANGDLVSVLLWKAVATPLYIKSITIYNAEQYAPLEQDTTREYINFEKEHVYSPVYYPQYSVSDTYGLSWMDIKEPDGADGLEVQYRYFAVTYSKVGADADHRPVVIRFTLKDTSEVSRIQMSYQKGKTAEVGLWGHKDVTVINGVAEIVLDDAAFTNGINANNSFRVWNVDRNPVGRDLVMVEVYAIKDKTELNGYLDNVAADTLYKTAASVEAYMAAVEAAKPVAENAWATQEEVDAALAAVKAAYEGLEDCLHLGETKLVNFVEATCLEEGYSGDTACAECGFIAEDAYGEVTPAHETRIINVTEPTCAEFGNTGDIYCDQCQQIAKKGQQIAKVPHTWDEGEITKPATKDEPGELTKTCDVCGATTILDVEFEAQIGDVNGDAKIDSTDARLVLQYAVQKITGSALDVSMSDVDNSGEVNSTDARLILQLAVGKIKEFPNR